MFAATFAPKKQLLGAFLFGPTGAQPRPNWRKSRVARDISRWGRGSVFLDVNENGRRLLRVLPGPDPVNPVTGLETPPS
jgi:hypothetical protein